MPVFDLIKTSFNAGIWSEMLDARSDLSRYQAACSQLENFVAHPYGGVSNRAGTEFVYSAQDKEVRLIPFQFNSEQSYILAFTQESARVLKDGGVIVDNDTEVVFNIPYTEEDIKTIQYVQSADVLYLVHHKYPPAKITRSSHVSWEFSYIFFENTVPTPTGLSVIPKDNNSKTVYYTYGLTLVDANDNEGELACIGDARIGDTLDFGKLPNQYQDCMKYNIYRMSSGIYGWVDSTVGASWVDQHEGGTLPDMEATPPASKNPFKDEGNYPACACIHQNRLVFAGTDNKPRTIFGSRVGAFCDFSVHSPLQDDDAYEFEISGGQVNRIEWLRSFNGVLLAGSGGGEYLVTGLGDSSAITPSSVMVKPQTSYGSAPLPSLVAGATVLFVQGGKNIIRDMFYSLESDQYNGTDLSVMSEHLFTNHQVVAVSWQRDPDYIFWAVRDDGILLGMTYVKEQQVWAWHKHTTQGEFTDVAVVRNNDGQDDLYLTVRRDGQYYVEMMRSRNLNATIDNAWFLDSAIEYYGEQATILSGLEHLEGKSVSVFSKGTVIEDLVVVDGSVTLPFPVTEAIAGLSYTSKLATMEVAILPSNRNSMSVINSIVGVTIYFKDTCRVRISAADSADLSKWKDVGVSLQHDLSSPYTLASGKFYYTLSAEGKLGDAEVARNRVYLRNDLPLPVSIAAFGVRVNTGDL